jgi:adenylate kinase
MNLILLGIPGSGKGSVAELLTSRLKVPHIAPGDILREELREKSELGLLARPFMEKGDLVPDDVILKVMEKRLGRPDSRKGFILDGFPRTLVQAEELDRVLLGSGRSIDFVIKFQVSDPTAMKRLSGRQTCSVCGAIYNIYQKPPRKKDVCDICGGALFQRADDKEEVIKKRLQVYGQRTQPIEEYYRRQRKLRPVDGETNPYGVLQEILAVVRPGGSQGGS